MRNKTIPVTLIVLSALVALCWLLYSSGLRPPFSRYRDFRFSGQIVGTDGLPLDGVQLGVLAWRKVDITRSKDDYEAVWLRDSSFSVTRNGYSGVRLKFMLDGYEYYWQDFIDGGNHANLRIVLRRKSPAPAASGPRR